MCRFSIVDKRKAYTTILPKDLLFVEINSTKGMVAEQQAID
jgi:hypothetical protein